MTRASLGVAALGMAALVAGASLSWLTGEAPEDASGARPESMLPRPLGSMDFELTDQDGRTVGPQDLVGRPSAVFFGFTHCPDVCPTTLADIGRWLDEIGERADELDVVFITVDPERDTVEAMAEYLSYFDPRIRGWTGTPGQIAAAAEGFRVKYEKLPGEGEAYAMNHTSSLFLYRADGTFKSTVDYHESRDLGVPKIDGVLQADPAEATP